MRRLKSLCCATAELVEVLQQNIISVCEVGVAWWGPMVYKAKINMLECNLKASLNIIHQEKYT